MRYSRFYIVLLAVLAALPARAAEPLAFRRAIELALHHASGLAIANADQVKARQAFLQGHDLYYPQVTAGSGLGASVGFPLSLEGSAPSIFNINASQFLINFSQRDLNRAAKTEWEAASATAQDRRNDVILDTAVTYLQLDKTTAALKVLERQLQAAQRVQQIVADRVHEGVDPETEITRAQLGVARVQMAIARSQGDADVLRLHLAALTGLPAETIATDPETVPDFPPPPPADGLVQRALDNSGAVKSAEQHALAQGFRARGEHRASLPSVDFAAQYAVLSRYNNYDQFFKKFERNNASIGVVIRFPFLNFSQKAAAEGADADAAKARAQAAQVRERVSTETLRLQHLVAQLTAAREIARLEYQLSTDDVAAAQARVQAGQATARDEQNARLVEAEKDAALLDATFLLDQAQLSLLRQAGDLSAWAVGQPQPAAAPRP